jgi:hypothetical protein
MFYILLCVFNVGLRIMLFNMLLLGLCIIRSIKILVVCILHQFCFVYFKYIIYVTKEAYEER